MCVCVCVPNSKPWFPVFSIFQEPDNEAWSLCVCVCVRERERERPQILLWADFKVFVDKICCII